MKASRYLTDCREVSKRLAVTISSKAAYDGEFETESGETHLLVDASALAKDENDVTKWVLKPVEGGLWWHPWSGTEPGPLSEALLAIASCYLTDPATGDPANRPLRVETYRTVEGDTTKHHEFRWRVVHASNAEVMASGEGYTAQVDRDHAVEVLFPGVEIVEVDG